MLPSWESEVTEVSTCRAVVSRLIMVSLLLSVPLRSPCLRIGCPLCVVFLTLVWAGLQARTFCLRCEDVLSLIFTLVVSVISCLPTTLR